MLQDNALFDFANRPEWMQDVEPVSLNAINITPLSFGASFDIVSWNHDNDDPTLNGAPIDVQIVQVLCINTSKFSSGDLVEIDKIPQAVPILDDDTPAVDGPILIDTKAVAIHNNNEVSGSTMVLMLLSPTSSSIFPTTSLTTQSSSALLG